MPKTGSNMKRIMLLSRNGVDVKMTLDTSADICLAETPLVDSDEKRNVTGTDYFMHETNSGEKHYYKYKWSNVSEGLDKILLITKETARDDIFNLPSRTIVTNEGLAHCDLNEA